MLSTHELKFGTFLLVTIILAISIITCDFGWIIGGKLRVCGQMRKLSIESISFKETESLMVKYREEVRRTKMEGAWISKITSTKRNNQLRNSSFYGRNDYDGAGEITAVEKPDSQESKSMNDLRNGLHGGRRTANKEQTRDLAHGETVEQTRKNRPQQTRMEQCVKGKKSSWKQCWKYDPASWTVTQMKPNCKASKEFKRRHSTVKRIIHVNKTIEYTVCNKSTRRCKEQPYFSWRLKKMVERPPCCIAHVLDTFKHVTETLDKANILYFLTVGGLVGWVKNKSMPRYENDLDILVDVLHWQRFKAGLRAMAKMHGHYVRFNKRLPNFVRIFYSHMNRVFIDAWPYKTVKINGTKWVKAVSALTWFPNPYTSIFPLRRTTYSGIPIWVPNDPEQVLDRHYGKRFAWRKNITCKTKDRNKCTT